MSPLGVRESNVGRIFLYLGTVDCYSSTTDGLILGIHDHRSRGLDQSRFVF